MGLYDVGGLQTINMYEFELLRAREQVVVEALVCCFVSRECVLFNTLLFQASMRINTICSLLQFTDSQPATPFSQRLVKTVTRKVVVGGMNGTVDV